MTEIHGHCIACLGCKGLGLSAGRLTALETHTNFIHGCKIDISVTGLTGTYQPPFEPDAVIARMQQGPWPRPDYIQLAHKEKALLVCFAASCFTASSTIAASTTRKLRTGLFNVAQSGAFWQKPWTSVQHGVKFLPTRTRTERTIHDSSRTKLQTRKFVQWKSGSTKGVCGGVICERRAATTSLARRRWGQHCSKQALFF